MVSCEQAKETAPLKFSSFDLEVTREASVSKVSRDLGRFQWVWICGGAGGGSDLALICSFTSLAKFQRRPPYLGA